VTAATVTATGSGTGATSEKFTSLEEVVVTAQKRQEDLEKVPVAVTVLSGNWIQETHATQLNELQGQLPDVQLDGFAKPAIASILHSRLGDHRTRPLCRQCRGIVVDGVPQYFNYASRSAGIALGACSIFERSSSRLYP
jgi:iron complex outermembrane receptor protein